MRELVSSGVRHWPAEEFATKLLVLVRHFCDAHHLGFAIRDRVAYQRYAEEIHAMRQAQLGPSAEDESMNTFRWRCSCWKILCG